MKKSLRILSWIFLPPLVLIGAFCLVLATESGFRFLVGFGDALSGPLFSAGKVRGHLLSSWQLEKVQVHVAGVVHVELEDLSWSWKPEALFHKDLHVSAIKARGLMVRLEESGNEKRRGHRLSFLKFISLLACRWMICRCMMRISFFPAVSIPSR